MISNVQDLTDAIAVERRMLEWASPRPPACMPAGEVDLRRAGNFQARAVGRAACDRRAEARNELRPLLFVTAWKVLDLMIKLAFHSLAKPNQEKWHIAEKATHARALRGSLPGLTENQNIWQRICLVYDATVEARHAVIHRRLELDFQQSFVNLPGHQTTLTLDHQNAMQGLALNASAVALRQTARQRDLLIISAYLNSLGSLHACLALPASSEERWTVIVDSEQQGGRWRFDANAVLAQAKFVAPNCSHFDVTIHLVGSGVAAPVRGALEVAAHAGVTEFVLGSTEPWMSP